MERGLKTWLLLLLSGLFVLVVGVGWVRAESCDQYESNSGVYLECLGREIDKLSEELQMSLAATAPLEAELNRLGSQIAGFQNQINEAKAEQNRIEEEIEEREDLLSEQYLILAEKTREYYKRLRNTSFLSLLLSSMGTGEATREMAYRNDANERDRQIILQLSGEIGSLEKDKTDLEERKKVLAGLQAELNKQADFYEGEVGKAKDYQSILSGQIASLTAKQQAILEAKYASAPVPLLAYTSLSGCSSDIGKSSGFSPRYGFFSLGVPNKTGLNQYGAKGRAEVGQNYEQILNAYYQNFQIVNYGTGFTITVNGTNEYGQTFSNESMNIEEYLKHLYEMPTDWSMEALKAQAIAARSYALYITNNGVSTVYPSQKNQVVKKEINDGRWQEAVNSTSGKVMVYGGSPIGAWYSSTHGGFVLSSGEIGWNDKPWTKHAVDAVSFGSIEDLKNSAYDKGSPWFYCDWGYRSEYNNTAWLKEEEVLDIVNAYVLWSLDNNMIVHLSQTDKGIADAWSADRVKQEILSKGGSPYVSISSINVDWDGTGISKTIRVNGNAFDAQKFKNMFNLRAPANIQIKPTCSLGDSSLVCSKMYGLYDVVKE